MFHALQLLPKMENMTFMEEERPWHLKISFPLMKTLNVSKIVIFNEILLHYWRGPKALICPKTDLLCERKLQLLNIICTSMIKSLNSKRKKHTFFKYVDKPCYTTVILLTFPMWNKNNWWQVWSGMREENHYVSLTFPTISPSPAAAA